MRSAISGTVGKFVELDVLLIVSTFSSPYNEFGISELNLPYLGTGVAVLLSNSGWILRPFGTIPLNKLS